MFTVTSYENNQQITLEEKGTIRIRRATPWEMKLEVGDQNAIATRLDHDDGSFYVKEEVDTLVASIAPAFPDLDMLLTPAQWPLWFDVKIAKGPNYVSPPLRTNGISSAISIGSGIDWQYVHNSPQDVAAMLTKHGVKPKPIIDDSNVAAVKKQRVSPPVTDVIAGV